MPRYFFNVLDGGPFRDDIGVECRDARAARVEALRTSGQMLQEVADGVRDWAMEVTDDRSRVVCVVRIFVEDVARPL